MVGREGNDHITDGYFSMINLKGINSKNKHGVQYSDVHSPIRPIPHNQDLLVPGLDGNLKYNSDSEIMTRLLELGMTYTS